MEAKVKVEKFGETFSKVFKKSGIRNISGEYVIMEQTLEKINSTLDNNDPQETMEVCDAEMVKEIEAWQIYVLKEVIKNRKNRDYKSDANKGLMKAWFAKMVAMQEETEVRTFVGLQK